MRLISICPSNTELIDYLGMTDRLVAVDDFSDYPERVQSLPKVGPDLSIDMEKVEKMEPDLVIASLSVPGMEKNIEELEKRKLPYLVFNPQFLDDVAADIKTLAEAVGHPEQGAEKAAAFLSEIEDFKQTAKRREQPPTLYWEWWPKPVFTPGRLNWLSEISRLAGTVNVFETEGTANFQTDWEEVKRRNPDHICMVWVGIKEEKMRPELIRSRPGWSEMKAVKEGNIHVLEESLFCRPSPRLLEGLRKLSITIHGRSR